MTADQTTAKMPRALLSVSDKTNLTTFAQALRLKGWTILSTGGTASALREAGIDVTEVSTVTGHSEIMDGRVKTLHPAVHAGLLARRGDVSHRDDLTRHGYEPIDLLAVNLYPFEETISRADASFEEAIENIDIGGPAMLRAAAKNHADVWVVVDPLDYDTVLDSLDRSGPDAASLRRQLARKVYEHTSRYDGLIAGYLERHEDAAAATELTAQRQRSEDAVTTTEPLPPRIQLTLARARDLRYGENPDQPAALYASNSEAGGLADLEQLHGKELSFNNLLDVDAALLAISPWDGDVACAIIKHTTPCGLAVGDAPAEAYRRALRTDPTSAFGSVVAFNSEVTEQAAVLLRPNFVEAVVAPAFAPRALDLLRERKNLRLLIAPPRYGSSRLDFKRVRGGFLVQQPMRMEFAEDGWSVATRREPTEDEWADLRFAWRAVATVKSNAILLARGGATLGIGAGQMSRVDSSRLAVLKAADQGLDTKGAALASDAFFPFRDGVDAAAEAGIRAIIQPGGSIRDEEVITAADEHGIAMVFTGRRLFRH